MTPEQKDKVRALYNAGEALCCHRGRQNLRGILPEEWVEHIATWSHERMGCIDDWKPGGRYFEEGKAKLETIMSMELEPMTEEQRLREVIAVAAEALWGARERGLHQLPSNKDLNEDGQPVDSPGRVHTLTLVERLREIAGGA